MCKILKFVNPKEEIEVGVIYTKVGREDWELCMAGLLSSTLVFAKGVYGEKLKRETENEWLAEDRFKVIRVDPEELFRIIGMKMMEYLGKGILEDVYEPIEACFGNSLIEFKY